MSRIRLVENFREFMDLASINQGPDGWSIYGSNPTTSKLIELTPNKYIYHTSNPIFRDMISKEGLIPKGKSETWLSDTKIDGKVIFAVNSDNREDWWDSTYDDDIYKIDTTKLKNKWYVDTNFDLEDKRIITFESIPLNSIKLIYKGKSAVLCQNCFHKWDIKKSDDSPYFCHDCGYDNKKKEFDLDKLKNWLNTHHRKENTD